jgi:hypothetical protein
MKTRMILIEKEVGGNCESCKYRNTTECQLFSDTLFSRTVNGKQQYQQLEACKDAYTRAVTFRQQR